MTKAYFAFISVLIVAIPAVAADVPELSIRQIVDLANQYNPGLKASQTRETQAQKEVGIAKSSYLPNLSFEAIDSTGYAASSGALGISGLMGSPFRSEAAAGFVLTQDIFDFGRTYYGVKASEARAQGQEKATDVDRYRADQEAIQAYFDCVLNRAQKDSWTELAKDSALVAHEVERFVLTGQRSIVDRYLANLQKEEALTQTARFETREKISVKRLSIITGLSTPFQCPALSSLNNDSGLRPPSGENPIVAYARDQRQAAESKLSQSKAENLPKVVGIASAGMLQDTRVVDKQDYALGIGLEIPLFEGFRVKDQVDRDAAAVEEKEFLVQASQYDLDDLNQQLDEKIESAAVRNQHLNGELNLAVEGFDTAKKRYFSFQGSLVDVRDSLTYLAQVKSDLNESKAEYLESKYVKEVLNGAR
jgi:outer membrane protein